VFEAANGGTLFLDEIGDVSPAIQVKLLRVLQEREIRRVGDSRTRKVDARLVTATNQDMKKLVADGTVREDFFYRIHVFEIHLPALRERKEDIPLLAEHFIDELCRSKGRTADGIARDALQLMMDYHWPGNVRQLRNAIEHAFVTVAGDRISYLDLPPELRDPHGMVADVASDLDADERAEREGIIDALRKTGGNRTKAAELLGTSRVTLWKKSVVMRLRFRVADVNRHRLVVKLLRFFRFDRTRSTASAQSRLNAESWQHPRLQYDPKDKKPQYECDFHFNSSLSSLVITCHVDCNPR